MYSFDKLISTVFICLDEGVTIKILMHYNHLYGKSGLEKSINSTVYIIIFKRCSIDSLHLARKSDSDLISDADRYIGRLWGR